MNRSASLGETHDIQKNLLVQNEQQEEKDIVNINQMFEDFLNLRQLRLSVTRNKQYELRDDQLQIYQSLLDYGFEEKVALFLIYSSGSNNINQLFEIIASDAEGFMTHLFYREDNDKQSII